MWDCTRNGILTVGLLLCLPALTVESQTLQVMLQGSSAAEITRLVQKAGGAITHDLPIINAVGAKLSREQLDEVLESPIITRHIDDLSSTDRPEEKPAKEDSCKVRGHIELDFSPQGIRWPLYNKLNEPSFIEKLEFTWPPSLGRVKALSVGNTSVAPSLYRDAMEGSLTVDFSNIKGPVVEERADLNISFQPLTVQDEYPSLQQSDFALTVSFTGGCSTDLVPGYENNHEDFYYNTVAGVDALHRQGVTGKGVTVAVVDSGLWEHDALVKDTEGRNRLLAKYDALTDIEGEEVVDESGHGTHMSSIIVNSEPTRQNSRPTGTYKGVAPDANLVAVKVLDREGLAHVLEIVRAIQWVVDHRQQYKIRILNLSFAQTPRWPYWEDPVNQAVMKAWAEGIAVVAAAGNEGPAPGTIGSPGNLPYIITVGAVTDSWTPDTRDDDYIPDFSSQGPTPSGHIKPDIVALGGHMTGLIHPDSSIATGQPEDILRTGEFVSTGSSQASALVSGILALLVQLEPDISPDELKCKLMTSAELAVNRDGMLAYSPFQQGNGYVTATRAVTLGQKECGTSMESLQAEFADDDHFLGPALVGDDGGASLPGLEEMVSATPSEKGLSTTRKWGVKDHIERQDSEINKPSAQVQSGKAAFDWQELYLLERDAIDALSRDTPVESPVNVVQ
jgi:serine protease AprX